VDPGLLAISPMTMAGLGDCGERWVLDGTSSGPRPIVAIPAVRPRTDGLGAALPPSGFRSGVVEE